MNFKKSFPLIALIILCVATLLIKRCDVSTANIKANTVQNVAHQKNAADSINNSENYSDNGLNRHPAKIIYTKHAKCRMGCRDINETEVEEILQNGEINYKKSELDGDSCHKKYAVEGNTNENQRLRIIFAPCSNNEVVVTVIDLAHEWKCDCE